jgi:D-lactate dehydrogenase (cytochrome)
MYMIKEHGGALDVMIAIKQALDPHNIMNPQKVGLE